MKILIADKISSSGIEYLKNQPEFEVLEAFGSKPEETIKQVKDVAAIIVRSETKITAKVVEAAQKLTVIGRAGVGVDNIDVETATQRGIIVMNTPAGNTLATAELTFTHMLCSARSVAQANVSMSEGKWERQTYAGTELSKKVFGIIGMGRIGSEVAKRAQAFSMRVIAFDPYLTPERAAALEVEQVDLDSLLQQADFISIHVPLTDDTRHIIDAKAFEKMKSGVRIINCARGGLIHEGDLIDALKSGKVAAAGLDVFVEEPLSEKSELRVIPNLVLTPHLGASTEEAQESIGLEVAQAITEVLRGGIITNAVNMPSVDARTLKILRPYLVLGEKLGTILQQISPPQIEKLIITYWGNIMDLDAMPLTRGIQRGYLLKISGEGVNDVNAPTIMKRLGIEVEIIKSNSESGYTELIRIEAISAEGQKYNIEGTLIGTRQQPRIVHVNSRDVEALPEGKLLLLENNDVPGIVGVLGTILGKDNVNIANMSLSRNDVGGVALTILQLDSIPSQRALDEVKEADAILNMHLVEF